VMRGGGGEQCRRRIRISPGLDASLSPVHPPSADGRALKTA
jgi:hypothetical protein